ncbi:MAG: serine/threonine protein kinase [Gemmatimonadales bacterium]|nr:serine/threonine protein kinase [Gemmatimonadales bacterium]
MAAGQEQLTSPSIEGYRIVRLIGSGGMGLVYEAVHEGDGFQHRVALKLIRHGMDSDRALRRFRQERQILARLQHPNIATLLDGGITGDGRPYLVIEYVDGTPLLSYCDSRRLGLRERIDLLLQIASAVGTAHQNLIVHRDLKPANVLVTPAGETKLLDFGIATLLRDSGDSGPATDVGARAYTPEYASPELIRGDPVTVAADVYALGVTACELLAGARPFGRGELSVTAFEQTVLNGEPPRPSSLVNETAARNRRESLTSLQRALRGELDNIMLMALRKDVDRRYPSVEALADDLRRHLGGQPVTAQPDRLAYRARKFVARNRAVVGLSALVAALLIGGIAVATDQARRAEAAAGAAERERSRAEAVSSFLVEMFAAPDSGPSGRPVTVV